MTMRKLIILVILYISSAVAVGLIFTLAAAFLLISSSCDEGTGTMARNQRGDIVKETLNICTGIGTVIDHSVVLLQTATNFLRRATTLIEYDPLAESSPIFRWIDDDNLSVGLGNVRSVRSQADKVGSIRISYLYIKVE